jgi:hypothetical protein
MIYNNDNMRDSVNRKGKLKRRRLVLNQFAWLLVNKREEVIGAFEDAGYERVDEDATPKQLKRIVRRAVMRLRDKRGNSPKAKKLISNLSILILANEQEKSQFSNFFKKKNKGADAGTDAGADAGAITPPDADASASQKSSWLADNSETIGSIGSSLLSGLFSNQGNDQVNSQISNQNNAGMMQPKKSNTGLIIGVGIGILALTGIGVYLYKRSK